MSHRSLNSVTVGCMVAALVASGDPESAHGLIHELAAEQENANVVNSVIFGTVIKGFAHQQKFPQAWSVYEEMRAAQVELTVVTYNTLIDSCARCHEAHRIPALLDDMAQVGLQRDIITYGAALKGYCQEGNIDMAIALLHVMREETDFKLDEMMYNSLLDGCAKSGLWSRAISIVEEMVSAGLRPSTFTLSALLKVGRRGTCSLETIFQTVQELADTHGAHLNVFVYTNLIHLCVDRKDWDRAMVVFENMIGDGVRPEGRTYNVLLKGLLFAGHHQMVDGVLRAALGIHGANAGLLTSAKQNASRLRPEAALPQQLLLEVLEGLISGGVVGIAHQLFRDMQQHGVAIDPKTKLRFTAQLANCIRQ